MQLSEGKHHSYNVKTLIEESLNQNGQDLRDKLEIKLLKLIMEAADANKKRLVAVLGGYDFKIFGKIV